MTMLRPAFLLSLACAGTLALGACGRQADSPHPQASVPGATGQGDADAAGHAAAAPPGTGLNGGLGTGTAMGAGPASGAENPAIANGSANTTPHSSVGNRP
jgi:hypothetical protein